MAIYREGGLLIAAAQRHFRGQIQRHRAFAALGDYGLGNRASEFRVTAGQIDASQQRTSWPRLSLPQTIFDNRQSIVGSSLDQKGFCPQIAQGNQRGVVRYQDIQASVKQVDSLPAEKEVEEPGAITRGQIEGLFWR
jgi:hypothetical protein